MRQSRLALAGRPEDEPQLLRQSVACGAEVSVRGYGLSGCAAHVVFPAARAIGEVVTAPIEHRPEVNAQRPMTSGR